MSTIEAPRDADAPLPAGTTAARHPSFAHLSDEDVAAIGGELDDLREEFLAKRGADDAAWIRRVLRLQQGLEVAGRVTMFGALWSLWFLVPGALLLAASKILDNMELGHNVMHGQYDFMNDPRFDSRTYEWDHASAGDQWRHSHNYMHHTFTNILGKDRDVGYGLLRMAEDQFHRPKHWFQPILALGLAMFFDLAIAIHDLEMNRLLSGRREFDDTVKDMARVGARKAGRQALKDFVLFPLLAFPVFLPVLLANMAANVLRNLWTFAVIFCGHFPEEVEMFDEEAVAGESHDEWYLRQMLGSANISGGPALSLWTGHLDHQIEHHLFPDMPSHRLREVAVHVRDLCERYDIDYHTGPFHRQFGNVVGRILKFTLPNRTLDRLGVSY